MSVTLYLRHGDCVDVLGEYAEGSVGAVVCDPPYGLEFMGKAWDNLCNVTSEGMRKGDAARILSVEAVGGFQDGAGGNPFSRSRIRYGRRAKWEDGGGFTAPGIGERDIEWPSFSATSKHGTSNPTCAVCGGRLRGAKKCECPKPHDHWKPIGKRKNPENEGLPDHLTGGGMTAHLNAMQEWHVAWLREAFRVLVPGGVLKAFSATRTFHRMAAAMQRAGFVKIGLESWSYGSGFPKSLNIGKAIDKMSGVDAGEQAAIQDYLRASREAKGLSKREVDVAVFGGTTRYSWVEGRGGGRSNEVYLPTPEEWEVLKSVLGLDDRFDTYIKTAIPCRENRFRADGGKAIQLGREVGDWGYQADGVRWGGERTITAPATEAAKTWDGWGTALKPSWEPVLVGRKPCAP